MKAEHLNLKLFFSLLSLYWGIIKQRKLHVGATLQSVSYSLMLMKKFIWNVIHRQSHCWVLPQQDGGVPGESLHARHRQELPPAARRVVLSHLQQHSHHRQHVVQHLRHQVRGVEGHLHVHLNEISLVVSVKSAAMWLLCVLHRCYCLHHRIKATLSFSTTRSTPSSCPTRLSSEERPWRSLSLASFPKPSASPVTTPSKSLNTFSPSPASAASATLLRYTETATLPIRWRPAPIQCRWSWWNHFTSEFKLSPTCQMWDCLWSRAKELLMTTLKTPSPTTSSGTGECSWMS